MPTFIPTVKSEFFEMSQISNFSEHKKFWCNLLSKGCKTLWQFANCVFGGGKPPPYNNNYYIPRGSGTALFLFTKTIVPFVFLKILLLIVLILFLLLPFVRLYLLTLILLNQLYLLLILLVRLLVHSIYLDFHY